MQQALMLTMVAVVVLKGFLSEFVFDLVLASVREDACTKLREEEKILREGNITTTRGNLQISFLPAPSCQLCLLFAGAGGLPELGGNEVGVKGMTQPRGF